MREGEEKIFKALLNNEGLTFTELKDETKLSSPGLSDNITRLINSGFVIRNPQNKRYHLRKGYTFSLDSRLTLDKKLMQLFEILTVLYARARIESTFEELSIVPNYSIDIEDYEKRKKQYIKELFFTFNNIILYSIWNISIYLIKNGKQDDFREYQEEILAPMLFTIYDLIRESKDVLDEFENNFELYKKDVEKQIIKQLHLTVNDS